jgi:hypothetical protein
LARLHVVDARRSLAAIPLLAGRARRPPGCRRSTTTAPTPPASGSSATWRTRRWSATRWCCASRTAPPNAAPDVSCPTLNAPSRETQANPLLDNYEGMAVTAGGPGLAGVSLIRDDNFSATQFTRVLNLIVALP